MKRRRIICVGNPFVPGDEIGPAVFERLSRLPLPDGVDLIDGGIRGLDLLPLVEGADRVVFVDTLSGFGAPGEPIAEDAEVFARDLDSAYGHCDGLGFLLRALPAAASGPLPEIVVAGTTSGASGDSLDRLAVMALEIADLKRGAR